MLAVRGDPVDDRPLGRHRAERPATPPGAAGLEAAMGQQPVIADGDAEAGERVGDRQHDEVVPAQHRAPRPPSAAREHGRRGDEDDDPDDALVARRARSQSCPRRARRRERRSARSAPLKARRGARRERESRGHPVRAGDANRVNRKMRFAMLVTGMASSPGSGLTGEGGPHGTAAVRRRRAARAVRCFRPGEHSALRPTLTCQSVRARLRS